jgi:hypothetical protein
MELTIRTDKENVWFGDSFEGTAHHTSPTLLFTPSDDSVLSAKVNVGFNTK